MKRQKAAVKLIVGTICALLVAGMVLMLPVNVYASGFEGRTTINIAHHETESVENSVSVNYLVEEPLGIQVQEIEKETIRETEQETRGFGNQSEKNEEIETDVLNNENKTDENQANKGQTDNSQTNDDQEDDEEGDGPEEPPTEEKKQGIFVENGKIYYYVDGEIAKTGLTTVVVDDVTKIYYFDTTTGEAFTGGYKIIKTDGISKYYYFDEQTGVAFTGGYKEIVVSGTTYYFYFESDGAAFTKGYKEVDRNGTKKYYYFLSNGQAYTKGYKIAEINGKKEYFYFGSDGAAIIGQAKTIQAGNKNYYFYFTEIGKAFTDGYKELTNGNVTNYYYYLANGQAFTGGYKTARINNATCYFFFGTDGKAVKNTYKDIKAGNNTYGFYFEGNGRAFTGGWKTVNANGLEVNYYFGSNGQASKTKDRRYDNAPPLYYGWSEFVGPWAFCHFAKDTSTTYTYHTVGDGYVPKPGDLIVTGADYDNFWIDCGWDLTGFRTFPYWHADYSWNGHILYCAAIDGNGNMTCYEGNGTPAGQYIADDDPYYIYKTIIDKVQINFAESKTLTPNKKQTKKIRAVIQTNFTNGAVNSINAKAEELYQGFKTNPESIRRSILNTYQFDIDWCALFTHYLLVNGLQ